MHFPRPEPMFTTLVEKDGVHYVVELKGARWWTRDHDCAVAQATGLNPNRITYAIKHADGTVVPVQRKYERNLVGVLLRFKIGDALVVYG
jgi:hypothetical protein